MFDYLTTMLNLLQEPGASEIKRRLEDRFKDESGYRDGEETTLVLTVLFL